MNLKKEFKSVLDPYEKDLMAMEEKKESLERMRKWLKKRRVKVTRTSISRFLQKKRPIWQESEYLDQIKATSRQCKDVEEVFKDNPMTALATLMNGHGNLIWKLTVREEPITKARTWTLTTKGIHKARQLR